MMGTMEVIVIETPQLGDRSYLVHDGSVALVIDPQRDTDRVEAAATAAGVVITHVAETHLHNDYLSGGLELARAHHASYLVNAADPVAFERAPIAGGQTVKVGSLTVKAVATPGHTHTHLSFVVDDDGGQRASSPAEACSTAPSAARTSSPTTTRSASPTTSTPPHGASPPRPGPTPRCSRPTASARSARPARPRARRPPRSASS
jgi:hypothetical protein